MTPEFEAFKENQTAVVETPEVDEEKLFVNHAGARGRFGSVVKQMT